MLLFCYPYRLTELDIQDLILLMTTAWYTTLTNVHTRHVTSAYTIVHFIEFRIYSSSMNEQQDCLHLHAFVMD